MIDIILHKCYTFFGKTQNGSIFEAQAQISSSHLILPNPHERLLPKSVRLCVFRSRRCLYRSYAVEGIRRSPCSQVTYMNSIMDRHDCNLHKSTLKKHDCLSLI